MKFSTKPCRVIQPYSYPRPVLNTRKLSHNKKQQTFLISLGQRFKENLVYATQTEWHLSLHKTVYAHLQYKYNISISKL